MTLIDFLKARLDESVYTERELVAFSAAALGMSLVPRLATVPSEVLPTSVVGMNTFLNKALPETRASLDDGAGGHPEGVVLRSLTRSTVAKARFVDYTRTLTPRQPKNRKKKQVAA